MPERVPLGARRRRRRAGRSSRRSCAAAARCWASAPPSETAQQLLNLPISRVATVQPFRIGGSLLRETFDTTQPAAWGLPSDWVTYFNGDRAFNVSGNAKVVGAYPGTGNMLASGYEEGAEQLRGKADVVSMDVDAGLGHGRRLAVDVPLVAALAVAAGLQLRLPRAVEGGHGAGAQGRRGRRVGGGEPGRRGARVAGDAGGRRSPRRTSRPRPLPRPRSRRRRRRRAPSPSARRRRSPSPASWPRASAR